MAHQWAWHTCDAPIPQIPGPLSEPPVREIFFFTVCGIEATMLCQGLLLGLKRTADGGTHFCGPATAARSA